MSQRLAFWLTGLFLLTFGSGLVLAQQFTADLVRLKPQGSAASRLLVSGDKLRFEARGGPHPSIVVVDVKQKTGFMALPDSKSYTPLQPEQIAAAATFFHTIDPENACPEWEKLTNKPGTCAKVGDETINGRKTIRYKGTARNGEIGSLWVDRKLSFAIKWEGQTSASELRNITEGRQAAALFETPKGYDQMDSRASRQNAGKNKSPKPKPPAQKPPND